MSFLIFYLLSGYFLLISRTNQKFELLHQCGVSLMRGVVKEVHAKKIVLNDGTDVPYGLLVWSTGVGPSQFVKSLDLPKSPGGRYMNQHFFLLSRLFLVDCLPVLNVLSI